MKENNPTFFSLVRYKCMPIKKNLALSFSSWNINLLFRVFFVSFFAFFLRTKKVKIVERETH